MSATQHRSLAGGERWWALSVHEQLGNVGSEVSRACKWRGRNEKIFQGAVARALELMDLTLDDPRHRRSVARLREIARAREVLVDHFLGANEYRSTAASLARYFDVHAIAASRLRRG